VASIGSFFIGQQFESGNHSLGVYVEHAKSAIHAKFYRGIEIAGNSYAGFEDDDACLTWAYHTCVSNTWSINTTTTTGTHNNSQSINKTIVGNFSCSLENWKMKLLDVDTYFTDLTKPLYDAIEIVKDKFRGCIDDPTCRAHVVVIFGSVIDLAMPFFLQYAFSCAMYWFNKARQTTKTASVNETSWFGDIFTYLMCSGLHWAFRLVGWKNDLFIALATQVCYQAVLVAFRFAVSLFSYRRTAPKKRRTLKETMEALAAEKKAEEEKAAAYKSRSWGLSWFTQQFPK
jgi:hypothetical protein